MVVNLNGVDMENEIQLCTQGSGDLINPNRLTHQDAIFRSAAKLLVNGFGGEDVPRNAMVGYLVCEGGWLYSCVLGTISEVIMREAEQFNEMCYYHDDHYEDKISYIPQRMADSDAYPDILEGSYYSLITIQR